MYLLEDTARLAADIKLALRTWTENKIDELCETRPRLKTASVYLKRGLNNWLEREERQVDDMVDILALFIADSEGKIDAGILFDDAIKIFSDMDVNFAKFANFAIEYGKGAISISIPRNVFFDMIFGELGKITITADDLLEIKNLLIESENHKGS